LDRQYPTLFDAIQNNHDTWEDNWYRKVRTAMEQSYDKVCARQNPRQIQAYAAGWQRLRLKKP
jgi:hypothetical protein